MVAPILNYPSPNNNYHKEHVLIMIRNLKRWTSYDLIEANGFSEENLGEEIFNTDFYLLSHNGAQDPILNYGNRKVLELWEITWDQLTSMYARNTAKQDDQSAREEMMRKVKGQNYVSGYDGVRVSRTGKEFKILNVTIWNLFTEGDKPYGQAAWFRKVEFI